MKTIILIGYYYQKDNEMCFFTSITKVRNKQSFVSDGFINILATLVFLIIHKQSKLVSRNEITNLNEVKILDLLLRLAKRVACNDGI